MRVKIQTSILSMKSLSTTEVYPGEIVSSINSAQGTREKLTATN